MLRSLEDILFRSHSILLKLDCPTRGSTRFKLRTQRREELKFKARFFFGARFWWLEISTVQVQRTDPDNQLISTAIQHHYLWGPLTLLISSRPLMRSLCRLSRRWHQQFCLSPSFAAHQNCLQSFQPVRQYRRPPARTRPLQARQPPVPTLGDPNIHEFEQQGPDASTRRPVHNPLDAEAAAVKAQLDELDRELAVMRQGPFGPNSEFMQSFSPDEREALLKALEQEGVTPPEAPDLLSDEDIEEIIREEEGKQPVPSGKPTLSVTLSVPVREKIYVKQFNAALKLAQEKDRDTEYFALWKWYLRCQQHVANFSLILPEDVWHFLWKSQSSRFYRPKHLTMLGKDMLKAEVALRDKEWLEYIDALQANSDIAAAADAWEAQRVRLGANEDVAELFWMTGVRLYVELGKPWKAQRLAFECYEHTTMFNPEALIMVISAWAKSQAPDAADRTWSCYLKLLTLLKVREDATTTLNILGRISSALLEAEQRDLALAVFKDMFLLSNETPQDSLSIFQKLRNGASESQSSSKDIVNQIGLSALISFPKFLLNKFFFAAWIKWLLGDGRTDDAALVVELAYERGIRPDAGPLNGLIAAWFRRGSPSDRQKAQDTAWAMIQARIEMVEARAARSSSGGAGKVSRPTVERAKPSFLRRGAPAATIETFSILLQNYTRRSDLANATHLTEVMTGPANLKPNSFIMNHWLYASLRSGQIAEVWAKYSSLKQSIAPDLETFAALWDTSKTVYSFSERHKGKFPDNRTVFAEMMVWFASLNGKGKKAASADFSAELYEQIVRVFCLSYDVQGTLCALHGLKQSFNALPHDEVTRLIVIQVARSYASDFAPPSLRAGSLRLKKSLQYQGAVKTITEIVMAITDKMVQLEQFDPAAAEQDESPEQQTLRLHVLTAFLRLVIERRLKDLSPKEVTEKILAVARQMQTEVPLDLLKGQDLGDLEV
jgi:hypothetical protein